MDLKTQQEAFALLTAGAMRDDATAMYDLGVFYQNGTGVTQDYGKAREWYEKVAAKDYAAAMSNLGALYENANGVPQDYAKARAHALSEQPHDRKQPGARTHVHGSR